MSKDPSASFRWIVSVLRARGVAFVVSGGLAAKSYGADRPLNDIDLEIHGADFPRILDDIKPYATFGPARWRDEKWDVPQIVLDHHGQVIDIADADDANIHDDAAGAWVPSPTDFSRTEPREIFGLLVPVIAPDALIAYKSLLNGGHQQADIRAVEAFLRKKKTG